MIDPQVAYDKIAGFETANELADYLLSEDCKGVRASAGMCPLAVYMRGQTGAASTASNKIKVYGLDKEDHFDHTPATECFMGLFDTGEFPDLVVGD